MFLNLSVISGLAYIILQSFTYYACLSWVAWRYERTRGIDAFHIVGCLAISIYLFHWIVNNLLHNAIWGLLLAGIIAYLLDELWCKKINLRDRPQDICIVITVASLALVFFDWMTDHKPISIPVEYHVTPTTGLLFAVISLTLILISQRSSASKIMRLGNSNRWAASYWMKNQKFSITTVIVPIIFILAAVSAWMAILAIPLSTTGVLSSTILRDVAIAVLVARVVSTRGFLITLGIALSIALLRVIAGYIFVNNFGQTAVEATVFICLMIWIKRRSSRTAWVLTNDR